MCRNTLCKVFRHFRTFLIISCSLKETCNSKRSHSNDISIRLRHSSLTEGSIKIQKLVASVFWELKVQRLMKAQSNPNPDCKNCLDYAPWLRRSVRGPSCSPSETHDPTKMAPDTWQAAFQGRTEELESSLFRHVVCIVQFGTTFYVWRATQSSPKTPPHTSSPSSHISDGAPRRPECRACRL